MSERREDDLSAIAWPGFVDILSAVIIMFVFFLMIVATALYFHILIFKSQLLADAAMSQMKVESEEKAIVHQMQTQFAESKEQEIEFDTNMDSLIIFFGSDSISLLSQNLDKIKTHIAQNVPGDPNGYNVKIEASKTPKTYENAARKVALARMLNVRNAILQAGFPSDTIDPGIVDGEEIKDTYHWVRVTFEKK
ncbi:MAG: hypothetical protein H6859_05125 [Rhodospirillales bacterium]|nr:hypothetical protein [Alphaproteobacteria bacterium]USO06551.1 MAG: hypothetical protein H6859_05125 [Rhodospirillales bacterium]